jgi:hypothetical protein
MYFIVCNYLFLFLFQLLSSSGAGHLFEQELTSVITPIDAPTNNLLGLSPGEVFYSAEYVFSSAECTFDSAECTFDSAENVIYSAECV